MSALSQQVSMVVLTHNRRAEVLRTLEKLHALPEAVPVILVDNASTDGTPEAARERYPQLVMMSLARNLGAAGRNLGVERARTAYVAFCDDDTWWAPGAVARAVSLLASHPRLAAVTGRVLVGPGEKEDPASARMAASPLANELGVPGSLVLGVMAGACMMRRDAYLAAGGYELRFFLGGEEALLALDLASAGWLMAYSPDVVIHHHPSPVRDNALRRRMLHRNALWCAWLRRALKPALRETAQLLREAARDRARARGMIDGMLGLPWALRERRVVPPHVEAALARIHAHYAGDWQARRFDGYGRWTLER